MSVEDVRQQKAMALLQYEEAKEELEKLQGEAKAVAYLLRAVAEFCEDLKSMGTPNRAIEVLAHNHGDDFRRAMDYDALLKLHDRIAQAKTRLLTAREVKQTLGMK